MCRSVTIPTPVDAFDLNYVFGDGDGNFDNNGGLDYKTPMLGTMTEDKWEDLRPDRQVTLLSDDCKMSGRV
jgi:Starch/carbohydrate-binding module (family 53)